MDRIRSTRRGRKREEAGENLGVPGVEGRIILKWVLKEAGSEGEDCTQLAQPTIQWRALVTMAMNLLVPHKQGLSSPAEKLWFNKYPAGWSCLHQTAPARLDSFTKCIHVRTQPF
jgi:hypothetical protein